MAVNVTVYDLDNYPDNSKTVVVDQKSVVPIGYGGDEQWVTTFTTTAYSDIANRTAIQDIYVIEPKNGWIKSSGLVGTGGKFTIASGTNDRIKIRMDNSGSAYTITLEEGNNLGGNVIAVDMEDKIQAIPTSSGYAAADSGFQLSYKNATVEYTNGKFKIASGSNSRYYTGTSRSSVAVTKQSADTCYETLGFDLSISSQVLAAIAPNEALLASNYTTGAASLVIGAGTGVVAGDCMMITDGSSTDYFTVLAVSGTTLTVPTNGTNSYVGISNSYTTAGVAKVQLLREQDPDNAPLPFFDSIDGIVRWGIKSIANQIDFSS